MKENVSRICRQQKFQAAADAAAAARERSQVQADRDDDDDDDGFEADRQQRRLRLLWPLGGGSSNYLLKENGHQ